MVHGMVSSNMQSVAGRGSAEPEDIGGKVVLFRSEATESVGDGIWVLTTSGMSVTLLYIVWLYS